MRLSDVFSAQSIAYRLTNEPTNNVAYLGQAFFPNKNKMGIDLKWIKGHKGAAIALKPSTYDALATIRPREGFKMLAEEMPLFRESMMITERDLAEIARAQESNDPYLAEVLNNMYDDAANLVAGAEVSAERMRMSLLAPINGDMVISVGLADNTIYAYNYDPQGEWKQNHYLGITGTNDKWDAPTTSKPLNDFDTAITKLAEAGSTAKYAVMTTATLNKLVESEQLKNALITSTGVKVAYLDKATAIDMIQRKTGLTVLVYDKTYRDYDGTTKKFFPDGYVSVIGEEALGSTWRGVTPEERSLMSDSDVNVSVMNDGVAVAVQTIYGPPVQYSTTASQICLPSFEGMNSVFVIKAY